MYALAETYKLGLCDDQFRNYAELGLNMSVTAYKHTSPALQILIALFTALFTITDDDILTTKIISTFPQRFFDGLPQLHPVLSGLTKVLASIREHYAPFSATIITTNSVDFIGAEMLVRDEEQGGRPDAYDMAAVYADWLRPKNGLGIGYAALIWPSDKFPRSKTYTQAIP